MRGGTEEILLPELAAQGKEVIMRDIEKADSDGNLLAIAVFCCIIGTALAILMWGLD